ncbi:MAG: two-component system response regulator [Ancylobacter novellus]|uniref:Two-component system response regulator n=1 Tax=Ancylobacter novellus TaxID=921 RepID=A0A2W5QTF4_ANCNO|nr:MAG: two-component system response regulator [Ancylobacter novellus]
MTAPVRSHREATLLLVEDDDIDAKAFERAMRKMKLLNPVRRARDGQEALEILQRNEVSSPFIILLDLNMPRMGGLEFLESVRRDPVLTGSVIFVLTTSKSDEDLTMAYKEHVAGYILKQGIEAGFLNVIDMIEHYWRVVELPVMERTDSK